MNERASRHRMHQQRLWEIQNGGRRGNLGNRWQQGPLSSVPRYAHLEQNLKKKQLQSERVEAIERENRLLLEKMSALYPPGSVDPTDGTFVLKPGVRINKNQMPLIDHANNGAGGGQSLLFLNRRGYAPLRITPPKPEEMIRTGLSTSRGPTSSSSRASA